jgi:hypothetical protein
LSNKQHETPTKHNIDKLSGLQDANNLYYVYLEIAEKLHNDTLKVQDKTELIKQIPLVRYTRSTSHKMYFSDKTELIKQTPLVRYTRSTSHQMCFSDKTELIKQTPHVRYTRSDSHKIHLSAGIT